ncbi:MAG: succinate--CoA ligase subunit beta, partial [Rhodospirillales bacterium]|nr:succinate--CoA ligase subunit beta [Rhodospirillales bacterium]
VEKAFNLVLSDECIDDILINIFAGINLCDWVAEGVIQAVRNSEPSIPVIVRLSGTNVEEGRKMIRESGLAIVSATTLAESAEMAVAAVAGKVVAAASNS